MASSAKDNVTGTAPVAENERSATIGIPGSTYEEQLQRNGQWALSEGSRHFDEKSAVFAALRNITRRLSELQIPYAVVGGMALFKHGLRRFTEDVDILVARADLKRIHESLIGRGYLPVHPASKHLRDTDSKVRIEFLTTGDYPGDGRKKPVAFPDPAGVAEVIDSIQYINLEKLVELKLASGMTGAGRLKDLADVESLIKLLQLPESFQERLDPYVREQFQSLWAQSRSRYVTEWTKEQVVQNSELLRTMQRDGVVTEPIDSAGGSVRLVTADPQVAAKYDMVEESEFWHG